MKNNKKIVNVTTIFVIMIIIITIWQCFKIVDTPLKIKDEEIIEVAEGDSFYGVLNKLSEEDKIKNEFLVKLYLKIRGIKPEVLAGTYKLDKSMTLDEIITLLSNDSSIGKIYITIPEGYTIDDIARELGVSKTTVSRAISGKGRIGQATRDRVLAFIKEHDYRPNVVARGLAQRKTYNIALLMPKDYVATEFLFFKDCMNGICEVASAHDYDIIISMVDGEDVSQIERLEANRKVDGIIVSRAVVSSKIQKYLKNCREPFVLIGPTSDPEIPFVDNKNQEAGKELTSILLMKGMRYLALLGGNESYNVTGSRYQGFLDAHQELGIPVDKNLIFMNADNQLVISDAVSKLYEAGADGIVCMDDVICSMCMSSLREKKIQVPMQMKVASMYDSKNLEYHNPPVTSIKFDTTGLGQMACIKLLEILGENPQEEIKPLNYQVILRESTQ